MFRILEQSSARPAVCGAEPRQDPGVLRPRHHVACRGHHGGDGDVQRAARSRPRSLPVQGRRSIDERAGHQHRRTRKPDLLFGRPVLEIAERSTIFEGVIASTISDVLWSGEGDPQRLRGNHGPFNTFDVMGVPPLIGRTPDANDARPGATPVVVLGYRFWQRQFGGDPNVLGRQMRLNDNMRTVIGVMPKRFMWRGADVYLPIVFQRGGVIEGVRTVHVLGRLKPGITDAQAEADLRPSSRT